MAETIARGITVHTAGELPVPGSKLPPFELTVPGLDQLDSAGLAGSRVVLNIFPSVDTATCAMSVRRFNELAAGLADTTVVCVSMDLPYALERFCGAEGIENVVTASAFRSSFGVDYGVHLVHRYQERGDATRATAELAPVILVAGAITLLGYATLINSSYPPLRSIGLVSAVSVVALAAASVLLLPALLTPRQSR